MKIMLGRTTAELLSTTLTKYGEGAGGMGKVLTFTTRPDGHQILICECPYFEEGKLRHVRGNYTHVAMENEGTFALPFEAAEDVAAYAQKFDGREPLILEYEPIEGEHGQGIFTVRAQLSEGVSVEVTDMSLWAHEPYAPYVRPLSLIMTSALAAALELAKQRGETITITAKAGANHLLFGDVKLYPEDWKRWREGGPLKAFKTTLTPRMVSDLLEWANSNEGRFTGVDLHAGKIALYVNMDSLSAGNWLDAN